jgi:SAM-dependent methyltransferase
MSALYDKEAVLYDLLYHDLDYEALATELHTHLGERGLEEGARVLDAACGTAKFTSPLNAWYCAAGFDLSEGQVKMGQKSFPHLNLWIADMANFKVEEPYDALVCMFSSIGYLVPQEKLAAGLACFAAALKPGGKLVIQPWFKPSVYIDGQPGLTSYDDDNIKISRQSVSRIEDGNAVLDFHFLVTRKGEDPEYFSNRHVLALVEPRTFLRLLDEAGFDVEYTEDGNLASRGLYSAAKREG